MAKTRKLKIYGQTQRSPLRPFKAATAPGKWWVEGSGHPPPLLPPPVRSSGQKVVARAPASDAPAHAYVAVHRKSHAQRRKQSKTFGNRGELPSPTVLEVSENFSSFQGDAVYLTNFRKEIF